MLVLLLLIKVNRKESAKNAIGTGATKLSGDVLTRKTGMTHDEAKKILNLTEFNENHENTATTTSSESKDLVMKEIKERYDHLFKTNEPSNGGSFYIQVFIF